MKSMYCGCTNELQILVKATLLDEKRNNKERT